MGGWGWGEPHASESKGEAAGLRPNPAGPLPREHSGTLIPRPSIESRSPQTPGKEAASSLSSADEARASDQVRKPQ